MADPARGDVWLADLGGGVGHEQQGRRPVLVLSVDQFNQGPADLLMVVPFTSKIAKSRAIPAHIPIDPPGGGLKSSSVILCDQVRTLSKNRLQVRWGAVDAATMTSVETVLRFLLGL